MAVLCGFLLLTASARADGVALNRGDVLAGVGNGMIAHFSPSGTLLDTLNTTQAGTEDTGMCFDSSGNLYATDFEANTMSKFDAGGNLVAATFGSGFNQDPESCVVDSSGNLFVGQADGSRNILKFDLSGNSLGSFAPATDSRGTDWIDLASDQCTVHYTGEGNLIKTFNVCTNTQGADFASGLAGPCFAHRILSDGGELVACSSNVYRLDSTGAVVQTYTPTGGTVSVLFALNLDPDGTSFWTADLGTGDIWRIDIASGNTLTEFNSGSGSVAGLAVVGELTASAQPNLTVTKAGTGSGTVTSSPTGISCGATCSAPFAKGTMVTLTAAPATGSTFAGWSGGGCSGTGTCMVTLNADTTVTATFNKVPPPPPPPPPVKKHHKKGPAHLRITHLASSANAAGCGTELAIIAALTDSSCTQGQLTVTGTINRKARGKVFVKVTYNTGSGPQTVTGKARIDHGHWTLTLPVTGINRDPNEPVYAIAAKFNGSRRVKPGHAKAKATIEVESATGIGPGKP